MAGSLTWSWAMPFLQRSFFHRCLGLGKDVITVLKDEDRVLFQDAQGVFSLTTPQLWEEPNQKIQAWDAEGFTSAEGSRFPCVSCRPKRSSPAGIAKEMAGSKRKKRIIGNG